MTELNVSALLAPISDASPTGENLEYDPAFGELLSAAAGKPEQRMGSSTLPGEPPDFAVVEQLARSLFTRTHDLRVATHLARAALELRGFEGLSVGLSLIRRLVEDHWPSVHPQIDPDDEDDLMLRLSALSGLVSPEMLSALRSTPLVTASSDSEVSLKHFLVASGELPQSPDGPRVDERSIEAVFRQIEPDTLRSLELALERSRQHLSAINAAFGKHARSAGPDFSRTDRLLHQAQGHVSARAKVHGPSEDASEPLPAAEAQAAGTPSPALPCPHDATLGGDVRSREQVVILLEKICNYYASYEPSSPLPLLLRRCQRLCHLSFKEIVADLTPSALKELDVIAGKEAPGK